MDVEPIIGGGFFHFCDWSVRSSATIALMEFNEVKREEIGTRGEWECTGHSSVQALGAGAPTREVETVLVGEDLLTSIPKELLQLVLNVPLMQWKTRGGMQWKTQVTGNCDDMV